MLHFKRNPGNPILKPQNNTLWDSVASFNASVAKDGKEYHLVYRAVSQPVSHFGVNLNLSSIGYAVSNDGINFTDRQRFIIPEKEWELFGCEDPRITKFNDKYYIFYTALSTYPFTPYGIKIGLVVTSDFQKIDQKYPVTNFNSKAMGLFPEKIKGKMAAVLTANTDIPPAKIALAFFDEEEQIWSPDFWTKWYLSLDNHVIPLLRHINDQIEVGTTPVKTGEGWLLLYAYIKNYFSPGRIFGIEAVLLDFDNPSKVIGRTKELILSPEEEYEHSGNVPNVIFPSGALIENDELKLYYGATDTTCALATCPLSDLLKEMHPVKTSTLIPLVDHNDLIVRFEGNPILSPIPEFAWESRAVFNPGAIYEKDKVHLLYRAMSRDNTSVLGYASSKNGFDIDERSIYPVYAPREDFEKKTKPFGNSGCEDPRLTKIGDRIYMCYTAFNGQNPPRVALTSISANDFTAKIWDWERPKLISPPGVDDKDAFILPKKIDDKFIIFHRIGLSAWIEKSDDLNFGNDRWLGGEVLICPRKDKWDSLKVGASAPAIETNQGWLLLYHGVSDRGNEYKLGFLLLDPNNPQKIIARSDKPVFEPVMPYEKVGQVPNVVFPCGCVAIKDSLFIYYGGADEVIGVATASLSKILETLKR